LPVGQAERAATLLRDALALWRGTPLAELEFEGFAQAEIARLEEQRLTAPEARIDADLAVGEHAEVVGELQQLVGEHLARENFAGQLMLALYRCGRQTEALDVYRDACQVLVDEVGVEPGPSCVAYRRRSCERMPRSTRRPCRGSFPPRRVSLTSV